MRRFIQSRYLAWWRDTNQKLIARGLTPLTMGEAYRAYTGRT